MKEPELAFYPKALPGESAGSVLLRLSQAHTERPTALFLTLGAPNCRLPDTIQNMYRGKSSPITKVVSLQAWSPCKATQEIVQRRNSKQWLEYQNPAVCPDCAREGWLPETHDFHIITCCTRHGKRLRTHCDHCGAQVRWNRYGLSRCHCFKLFGASKTASEGELAVTRQLEAWIRCGETAALSAYRDLLSLLHLRISGDEDWAPAIIGYIRGDVLPLATQMKPFLQAAYPLGARALVAALYSARTPAVKQALLPLSETLEHLPEADEEKALPKGFHLLRGELVFALGCKSPTVDDLLDQKVIKSALAAGSANQRHVRLSELQRLYRCFRHPDRQPNRRITLGQFAATRKLKVADLVKELLAGQLTAAGAKSWRLSDILVIPPSEPVSDVPEGYATLSQAKDILEMNKEYISGFRRAGLLSEHHQRSKNNRYLYAIAELQAFKESYITAGEIGGLSQTRSTEVADKLRCIGIQPVSGPGIDASLVFVFLRETIAQVDLNQALSISKGYATSGRKRSSAPRIDPNRWMTGAEAAETLGLSSQQLYALAHRGLLVATRPEHADSKVKHYFRRRQVTDMKRTLLECVSVDHLAVQCGVSRKQVLTRLSRLLKSRPIHYQGEAQITLEDAGRLEQHFAQYWDAAQASAFLKVKTTDIHNWKRLGHLTALKPDHPGYLETPTLFESRAIKAFEGPRHRGQPTIKEPQGG